MPEYTERVGVSATSGALTPLRQRVFRALWIASVASNIGTWMQNVGAAWLMTSLNPSPTYVAMVQAATTLPVFLLGLPAGAIADLVDRRKLLLITQSWMTAAAAILGVITLTHHTTAWSLLGLTFALGLGASLNAPAWQAIMPDLVSPEELAPAITLNSVGFNIARTIGPAVSGLLIAATSPAVSFLLNAASFLGVIWVLYRWPNANGKGLAPAEPLWEAMSIGMRYVATSRPLRAVVLRAGVFVLGGSSLWALMPLLAKVELASGSDGYGALLACIGVGAVFGSWLLSWARPRYSVDAIVFAGIALFSVAMVMAALVHRLPFACVAMALTGIAWITILSSFNTVVQTVAPDWVRARALAVYIFFVQGGLAIGSFLWGPVASGLGIGRTFLAAGVGTFLSLVLFARVKLAGPVAQ